ncbi:MAG: hypothetical protein VYB65_09645 [Myxococcota bacterium]|nr:hypothetical protein [Myxococcota bacterium]
MTRIHPHTLQQPAAPQPRQAPAHQADEPAPPGASSAPLKDGFDRSAPPQEALGAAPMNESSRLQLERQLRTSAERVASVFPEPMRPAVQDALDVSIRRIGEAKASGQIDALEANQATEMMRELFEGLTDLRTGDAQVTVRPNDNAGVSVWRLRGVDGDEFQVTARRRVDAFGEARISFRQVLDDDQRLPGRHRVSLRVDLERFGQASVDMQFGGSSLDKRIHGLMKNPDGTVFETPSGKQLADHHFRDQLPDHIEDPEVFAQLVEGFSRGIMQPLEQLP